MDYIPGNPVALAPSRAHDAANGAPRLERGSPVSRAAVRMTAVRASAERRCPGRMPGAWSVIK